jgi:hypothetical protein
MKTRKRIGEKKSRAASMSWIRELRRRFLGPSRDVRFSGGLVARPNAEFHPEAISEARAAYQWYAKRNPSAANAFIAELDTKAGAPKRSRVKEQKMFGLTPVTGHLIMQDTPTCRPEIVKEIAGGFVRLGRRHGGIAPA